MPGRTSANRNILCVRAWPGVRPWIRMLLQRPKAGKSCRFLQFPGYILSDDFVTAGQTIDRGLLKFPEDRVIEAGASESSLLAYVITLMPSASALRAWVPAYKLSTETTEEFDEGKTTGSLGEVMRQVVEEDVQSCSEHLIGDSNPIGE
jgi:hypothetical protein